MCCLYLVFSHCGLGVEPRHDGERVDVEQGIGDRLFEQQVLSVTKSASFGMLVQLTAWPAPAELVGERAKRPSMKVLVKYQSVMPAGVVGWSETKWLGWVGPPEVSSSISRWSTRLVASKSA